MSNVIKFPSLNEEDSIAYTAIGGDLGISTINRKIGIVRLNKNEFTVITSSDSELHSRKELAEFLWFAATFIDSEERWRKDGEMVACNYE